MSARVLILIILVIRHAPDIGPWPPDLVIYTVLHCLTLLGHCLHCFALFSTISLGLVAVSIRSTRAFNPKRNLVRGGVFLDKTCPLPGVF